MLFLYCGCNDESRVGTQYAKLFAVDWGRMCQPHYKERQMASCALAEANLFINYLRVA